MEKYFDMDDEGGEEDAGGDADAEGFGGFGEGKEGEEECDMEDVY